MRPRLGLASLVVALASFASLPGFAQTASGRALVPPVDNRYFSSTDYFAESFFITNITSNPISVSLNIYNQAGTLVTGGIVVVNGNGSGVSNFALNSGGSTAVLTLAANSTTQLSYTSASLDTGYASIGWTQSNSRESYGLLADAKEVYYISGAYTIRTIAVNNNLPF